MLFFTSLLGAMSVFLGALWYLRNRSRLEIRLRSLAQQQQMIVDQGAPFNERVAFPVIHSLVTTLMAILPTSLVGRAKTWLTVAGDRTSASQFFAVVLVAATLLPAAYFALIWAATGGSLTVVALLPLPVLAFVGVFFPLMFLRRIAKNRQKAIWRSMPNALDLMTTCVEAGLSLDFALQRVAEKYKGPLSDEIHRTLREIGLGKPRRDALADMAERVQIPDLLTFVNSLGQAETLGTSVGNVLRAQATDMRRRRRQRAEQIARQAPVKMVFPTVFFLMPSLFIITIGPMLISVFSSLHKS